MILSFLVQTEYDVQFDRYLIQNIFQGSSLWRLKLNRKPMSTFVNVISVSIFLSSVNIAWQNFIRITGFDDYHARGQSMYKITVGPFNGSNQVNARNVKSREIKQQNKTLFDTNFPVYVSRVQTVWSRVLGVAMIISNWGWHPFPESFISVNRIKMLTCFKFQLHKFRLTVSM